MFFWWCTNPLFEVSEGVSVPDGEPMPTFAGPNSSVDPALEPAAAALEAAEVPAAILILRSTVVFLGGEGPGLSPKRVRQS